MVVLISGSLKTINLPTAHNQIQLNFCVSGSKCWIFFCETPLAELLTCRLQDFLHTVSRAEPHLPKDPIDLAALQPP